MRLAYTAASGLIETESIPALTRNSVNSGYTDGLLKQLREVFLEELYFFKRKLIESGVLIYYYLTTFDFFFQNLALNHLFAFYYFRSDLFSDKLVVSLT